MQVTQLKTGASRAVIVAPFVVNDTAARERAVRAGMNSRGWWRRTGCGRDLLGTADPPEWVQRAYLSLGLGCGAGLLAGEEGVVTVGGDGSERDGVHPDAARPVVDGQCPGQPLDPRLGGRVRQGAADRPLRLVGGDTTCASPETSGWPQTTTQPSVTSAWPIKTIHST
jgi:hypothetical protein